MPCSPRPATLRAVIAQVEHQLTELGCRAKEHAWTGDLAAPIQR